MFKFLRNLQIENTIADATDFFHMDALSAAVPLRVDFDVQLTLMASSLYRLLGLRVGEGFATAKARTLFDKLVRATSRSPPPRLSSASDGVPTTRC